MSARSAPYWGAPAALLAGAFWLFLSLDSLVRPDPERYRDALFIIPWLLAAVAVVAIHTLQRAAAGRLGKVGLWLLIAGIAAGVVGIFSSLTDAEALKWLGFPVGALGWMGGLVLFGVATVRARVLPRWCGVALILAQPLAILLGMVLSPIAPLHEYGSYTGALALAVVWASLGAALWSRRDSEVRHIRADDGAGAVVRRSAAP